VANVAGANGKNPVQKKVPMIFERRFNKATDPRLILKNE
jgi:hypothetical protein